MTDKLRKIGGFLIARLSGALTSASSWLALLSAHLRELGRRVDPDRNW